MIDKTERGATGWPKKKNPLVDEVHRACLRYCHPLNPPQEKIQLDIGKVKESKSKSSI